MDNALDDLAEPDVCSSIADVEALQAKHDEYKNQDLQEANANYEALNGLVTTMAEMGSSDNPYTALTPQVPITPSLMCASIRVPYFLFIGCVRQVVLRVGRCASLRGQARARVGETEE